MGTGANVRRLGPIAVRREVTSAHARRVPVRAVWARWPDAPIVLLGSVPDAERGLPEDFDAACGQSSPNPSLAQTETIVAGILRPFSINFRPCVRCLGNFR